MDKRLRVKNDRIIEFKRMEMMGIVNATPDSFFEGSRAKTIEEAYEKAMEHIRQGALIVDIGGESTRPGSDPVTAEEEIDRVCPVIERIAHAAPQVVISVDTYREKTAREALRAGAHMINDISGLTFEPGLGDVVAEAGAGIVLMHTPDRPDRMQDDPSYDDVVREVGEFLERQAAFALGCGIGRDQIMVDVGIGFGKKDEHNLALLKEIERFNDLGYPQLLAVSRKSLIGRTLAGTGGSEKEMILPPEGRLFGTVALTAYAALKGLAAARVHDVRENLEAARMVEAVWKR